ncbi:MAG TPA: M1 family metallopeptidase [Solirubrobacter sp.]|nr:M1 family metallopeptidase [Solirubrobacter sp.]
MKRILLLVAAVVALIAAPAAHAVPSPGAAGIGDPLFPQLGNGGYDVQHYDLDLRYATSAPSQPIDGTVTILAKATQDLSRFDLDFAGRSVGAVSVNGAPASFTRDREDLVITPKRPLRRNLPFLVTVSHFTAVPTVADPSDGATTAFFVHSSGSATAPQPNWAHLFLPSNDHPRDKATYDIRFDVPAGTTAVANGVKLAQWTAGGRSHFVYVQRQPMATELLQLAVGSYDVTTVGVRDGVFLRDVTAKPITARIQPLLGVTPDQMRWMQARAGRYPFDLYGSLVVEADLGFALETQTLELMDTSWFEDPQDVWDPTLLHEMSHMWFGDSVSPYSWSDLWLNEGHASWYEFTYAEERGFLEGDTEFYPDPTGYAHLDDLMKAVYAHGDEWRAESGPVAKPTSADTLFDLQRYHGGALVLYALRQKIGAAAFQRIERAYVQRFANQSVSTDDYIALAAQVSGRPDVVPFLRDWLYGTQTPPMPGHPDWTVNPPAAAPAPTTLSAPAARARRR